MTASGPTSSVAHNNKEIGMARKLSIMDSGWLMMETRETPMHVGGLALFGVPEDAPSDYMESVYRYMVEVLSLIHI